MTAETLRKEIFSHTVVARVVESEDFLGFRLRLLTPTPAVLKNRLRLQQFWKTDSDSDSSSFKKPTPTPDSDSSNFKKTTPTPDSDSSWKHATPPTPTPDSDSTTLAVTAVVAASYL